MTFAMVFPGQGAQSVGMLEGYEDRPEVREVLGIACEVLQQDIGALMAEGPAEDLHKTVNTQPIMLTAGYAAFRVWQTLGGPLPNDMAGHSLGEDTALVVAGALSFADCLPLVRLRAQEMQSAVPEGEGAMAAVLGLDDEVVRATCAEAAQGEIVEAVNFNAPGQVVIAGHTAAVRRAMELAKSRGAKRTVSLPVSAPFHSSLLASAAASLAARLATIEFSTPRIDVIHNVDAQSHASPEAVKRALVSQACHPVRWVECVQAIAARGITFVGECGPGKILAPLVKRSAPLATGYSLGDIASMEAAIAMLAEEHA
jgi:[acyl-carrier-protein] S-malonyltransferase